MYAMVLAATARKDILWGGSSSESRNSAVLNFEDLQLSVWRVFLQITEPLIERLEVWTGRIERFK